MAVFTARMLAMDAAKIAAERLVPLTGDEEITLQWNIPYGAVEEAKAWVQLNRRTVTDTKLARRSLDGTWRSVSFEVRHNVRDKTTDIFHTFGEGWQIDLNQKNARMRIVSGDAQTNVLSFEQYWPYVDPKKADDLAPDLTAITTVTNPKAAGETWTGTWAVGKIPGQTNEDGSVRLGRLLTKVTAIPTAATSDDIVTILKAMTKTCSSEAEILNLFGIQTGAGKAVVCMWSGFAPDDTTKAALRDTLTDAGLEDSDLGPSAAYSYHSRKVVTSQDTNVVTLTVVYRDVDWNNTTPTYKHLATSNTGGWGETKMTKADETDISKITAQLGAAGETTRSVQAAEGDFGKATITALTITGAELEIVTSVQDPVKGKAAMSVKTWYGVKPSVRVARFNTAKAWFDTGHTHLNATQRIGPDGWATIVASSVNLDAGQTWAGYGASAGKTGVYYVRSTDQTTGIITLLAMTYTYDVSYTATAASARDAISGGFNVPVMRSGIREIIKGVLWEATKIHILAPGGGDVIVNP